MRSTIKKILKESKDYFGHSVYVVMSDDEKFIKYNIHIAGEKYFSGGPEGDGWEDINRLSIKSFDEFTFSEEMNGRGIISIMPQKYLDKYKPKIVKYNVGYIRANDDVSGYFDSLNESTEDFKPKKGDYIYAVKPIFLDGDPDDQATTTGKFYRIEGIPEHNKRQIIFTNDQNSMHHLTPGNDFFKEYFIYVPEEQYDNTKSTDSLFDSLNENEEDDFSWVEKVPNIETKEDLLSYLKTLLEGSKFLFREHWHQGNRYFLVEDVYKRKLMYVFPAHLINKSYLKYRINQHNSEFTRPEDFYWVKMPGTDRNDRYQEQWLREYYYNRYKEIEKIILAVTE